MAFRLKIVNPSADDIREYRGLKEFLQTANAGGYPITEVIITNKGPGVDGDSVDQSDGLKENGVKIILAKKDLVTEDLTIMLQAAGVGEQSESFAKFATRVLSADHRQDKNLTSVSCSMKVTRENRLWTYCLELPLNAPFSDKPVDPPPSILKDIKSEDGRVIVLDETTTIEDIKRADGLLILQEKTLQRLPTCPIEKDRLADPGAFITSKDGKRYLKRVIDEKTTAFIWQERPDVIVDRLHRSVLKLMDFVIGYGCAYGAFEEDLAPNQGYSVIVPAETWLTYTGDEATGTAYRELRACLFSLTCLRVGYSVINSKAIKEGTFVLVQAAELKKNEQGKQEIRVMFSAPYSEILHNKAKKRVTCKVPKQAFLSDNKRNPLTFPIIHQLSNHTGRFLSSPGRRNRVRVETLLHNLQGQMTPYSQYKKRSDWKRKTAVPLLRDLLNAVLLGALQGYRFTWDNGTGMEDRPPRSMEEFKRLWLNFWLNIDEGGRQPKTEAIAAGVDPEPRNWEHYGVCSVGMKTIPRAPSKKTRKKRTKP